MTKFNEMVHILEYTAPLSKEIIVIIVTDFFVDRRNSINLHKFSLWLVCSQV